MKYEVVSRALSDAILRKEDLAFKHLNEALEAKSMLQAQQSWRLFFVLEIEESSDLDRSQTRLQNYGFREVTVR